MTHKHYETVFILPPVLSEEQTKETVKKYTEWLKEQGGQLVHQEAWGLKELAYPIQKHDKGIYQVIEFKAPADIVAKLERKYKIDEKVIRFMTVTLDKYGVAYLEQKRAEDAKKEKEPKQQSPVAKENKTNEQKVV